MHCIIAYSVAMDLFCWCSCWGKTFYIYRCPLCVYSSLLLLWWLGCKISSWPRTERSVWRVGHCSTKIVIHATTMGGDLPHVIASKLENAKRPLDLKKSCTHALKAVRDAYWGLDFTWERGICTVCGLGCCILEYTLERGMWSCFLCSFVERQV